MTPETKPSLPMGISHGVAFPAGARLQLLDLWFRPALFYPALRVKQPAPLVAAAALLVLVANIPGLLIWNLSYAQPGLLLEGASMFLARAPVAVIVGAWSAGTGLLWFMLRLRWAGVGGQGRAGAAAWLFSELVAAVPMLMMHVLQACAVMLGAEPLGDHLMVASLAWLPRAWAAWSAYQGVGRAYPEMQAGMLRRWFLWMPGALLAWSALGSLGMLAARAF